MSNPIAFVLLDAPTKLNAAALLEALVARHPDQRCFIPPDDSGGGAPIVLTLAGKLVTVMQNDGLLPEGWQKAAQRAAWYWPEAESVFKRHRAHFVVSVMGEGKDRQQVARIITAVAGALVATHPLCTAMLWDSTVANSSRYVADASRLAFKDYPGFPGLLWVSLNPFSDPARPLVVVITWGLSRFIGREVELDGPASQRPRVLKMTQWLVAYLIQYGAKVRDGDTVGASASERISLHFYASLRFNGLPVIAAELPATQSEATPAAQPDMSGRGAAPERDFQQRAGSGGHAATARDREPNSAEMAAPAGRRPKKRKFYLVASSVVSRASGFELLNGEQLFKGGPPIFAPPLGQRCGFRDYPERPVFLADAKLGRIHWDFEEYSGYLFISDRMKSVLLGIDPEAFAFLHCDIPTPDGKDASVRWLCDVIRVLDALDEGRSAVQIGTAESGRKVYHFGYGARLIFNEFIVGNSHIFRMKYFEPTIICDEAFKQACKSAKVAGISFQPAE